MEQVGMIGKMRFAVKPRKLNVSWSIIVKSKYLLVDDLVCGERSSPSSVHLSSWFLLFFPTTIMVRVFIIKMTSQ